MSMVLLHSFLTLFPLGDWYLSDPSTRTPILPSAAIPGAIGGMLPPPWSPSDSYIMAVLADANRTPGDVIVGRRLEQEKVLAPRLIPRVGLARLWLVTYRVDVVGPDGPYSVYVDRAALVLTQ